MQACTKHIIFTLLVITFVISCKINHKEEFIENENIIELNPIIKTTIKKNENTPIYNIKSKELIVDTLIPENSDTKIDDSFFFSLNYAYDVIKDTVFHIGWHNSLYALTKDSSRFISKLPIHYSILDLLVFDNYIVATTGDLRPDVMYLFDKYTMDLIDSMPNFQIRARISKNICTFINDMRSDNSFNFGLFDFNIMDTIFLFPDNKIVNYFEDKFFLFDDKRVEVYNKDLKKEYEFDKNGYYNEFGYFKENYFGLTKEKLHFYKSDADISFGISLNNYKTQLLDNKLYIYGLTIKNGIFKLLKYEVDES